jgi:hypothetical protein
MRPQPPSTAPCGATKFGPGGRSRRSESARGINRHTSPRTRMQNTIAPATTTLQIMPCELQSARRMLRSRPEQQWRTPTAIVSPRQVAPVPRHANGKRCAASLYSRLDKGIRAAKICRKDSTQKRDVYGRCRVASRQGLTIRSFSTHRHKHQPVVMSVYSSMSCAWRCHTMLTVMPTCASGPNRA